jgi:hypothetical protein
LSATKCSGATTAWKTQWPSRRQAGHESRAAAGPDRNF